MMLYCCGLISVSWQHDHISWFSYCLVQHDYVCNVSYVLLQYEYASYYCCHDVWVKFYFAYNNDVLFICVGNNGFCEKLIAAWERKCKRERGLVVCVLLLLQDERPSRGCMRMRVEKWEIQANKVWVFIKACY